MPKNCSLCRADSSRQMFTKDGIPYYRCRACGFVYSRPSRNANLQNSIEDYEPAYLAYLAESGEDEKNFRILLDWAGSLHGLQGTRALDVGVGSGKFVRFLRRNGVEAHGIEPAKPLYSKFLADEPYFHLATIEEFSRSPRAGKFGAIFACDVIEHVERPADFVQCLSHLLEPGGMLFISTPNVESVPARLIGRWWHYYNKYHLSYLSRSTMRALASRSGLDEVSFRCFPRLKSAEFLIQYFAEFVAGGRAPRLPRWLNDVSVPINLYDTMNVAFQAPPTRGAAFPAASGVL